MTAILSAFIVIQLIKYGLDLLNIRYLKSRAGLVPPEYVGLVDEGLLKKTQGYTVETEKFSMVSSLFSNLLIIIFVFGGVLDWYNSRVLALDLPFVATGWVFLVLLYLASRIISIPSGLYHTFLIENRFGFNTTTPRLWLSDLLKSLAVNVLVLSAVGVAVFALVLYSPDRWWFWVWLFLLVFSVFVIYISPYVIDPLFNRFTPLDDGGLRQDIFDLVNRAEIRINKILKMDASKRSRHSNAYFTGIGKTKRIVLFDTLLETMNPSEITSVLAHEIGHWKKHHVFKSFVMIQTAFLAAFYGGFRLIESDVLPRLFYMASPSFFAKALLAVFLAGMVFFFITPLFNLVSRFHERQSDRYACILSGNGEALIMALIKLSKENLSNLYPHPLYAAVYYSHPSLLQRIRQIREWCDAPDGRERGAKE